MTMWLGAATALAVAVLSWIAAWSRERGLGPIAPWWVLLGSALSGGMIMRAASSPTALLVAAAAAILFVHAATDLRTGRLYNRVGMLGLLIIAGLALYGHDLGRAAIAALVPLVVLTGLNMLYRGRLFGYGDAKAAAFVGISLGTPVGMVAVAMSLLVACVVIRRRGVKQRTAAASPGADATDEVKAAPSHPLAVYYLTATLVLLGLERTVGGALAMGQ